MKLPKEFLERYPNDPPCAFDSGAESAAEWLLEKVCDGCGFATQNWDYCHKVQRKPIPITRAEWLARLVENHIANVGKMVEEER